MAIWNSNYNHETYLAQIARGQIDGAENFGSYGSSTSSGAAANALIFPNGAYTFSYPNQSTGESVTFVSSSAEDGAGTQTGINSVHIHYLDINLDPKTVVVTLNGLTPVTTVTFPDSTTGALTGVRFIQCMHVATAGSTKRAVGDIIAYRTGAGTPANEVFSIIKALDTRCSSSMRMVPRGKIWMVDGAAASSVSATADTSASIRIFATELAGHTYHDDFIRMPHGEIGTQNNSIPYLFKPPLKFQAGSVVGGEYDSNKATTTTMSIFGWIENAPV